MEEVANMTSRGGEGVRTVVTRRNFIESVFQGQSQCFVLAPDVATECTQNRKCELLYSPHFIMSNPMHTQ